MGSLNSFVSLPEGINISDSLIRWLIFNTLIYLSLVTISIWVSLLLSLHDHHFFSIGEKQLEPILSISMLAALMVDSHPSRYLPADIFEDICQETTSGCKMFDGSLMKRLSDSKWSIFGFFWQHFFLFMEEDERIPPESCLPLVMVWNQSLSLVILHTPKRNLVESGRMYWNCSIGFGFQLRLFFFIWYWLYILTPGWCFTISTQHV